MLQLQPVYTGSVGHLHVEVIVVVVKLIDDPDAERIGVPKGSIIDLGDLKVVSKLRVPGGIHDGINVSKCRIQGIHL